MKRIWTKAEELDRLKDLFKRELTGATEIAIVSFDQVVALLEKPDPNRIIWNRVCRREFSRWGLKVSIRNSQRAYKVQIVDRVLWHKATAGNSEDTLPHDQAPIQADPERESLIPSSDPDFLLPEWSNHLRDSIMDGDKVLLTGPTGSGKSSLVRELCARQRKPFMRINLNGETSVADIVGGWRVRGKEMQFQYGPIPQAMKVGAWLCLDELDAALPQVLFVLQALLEDNGKLFIADTNEWVTHHPDFRIAATANTIGKGDDSGLYAGNPRSQ